MSSVSGVSFFCPVGVFLILFPIIPSSLEKKPHYFSIDDRLVPLCSCVAAHLMEMPESAPLPRASLGPRRERLLDGARDGEHPPVRAAHAGNHQPNRRLLARRVAGERDLGRRGSPSGGGGGAGSVAGSARDGAPRSRRSC